MKLAFTRSFAKDLRKIRDRSLIDQLREVIHNIEAAGNVQDIKNLTRLSQEGRYYRIRLGDYRLGLIIEANTATLVRILHRKDIYRYFP